MRFDLTGHVSDPDAAWTAVADTDWINRVAGNGRVLGLDVRVDDADYPQVVGALAGPLGTRMPFTEDENGWVAGQWFVQGRTYQGGPLVSSRYEARLEKVDGGVVPKLSLELIPRLPLLNPIVLASLTRVRNRWYGLLAGIPEPGARAQLVPLRTLTRPAEEALGRWRSHASAEVAERVSEHLLVARPLELQQMRAFELADRWGIDRDRLLRDLVAGAHAGLLELYWSVRCPRCTAQTASTPHLGNVADHATCPSCRIGFGADLSTNVEVLFAPHPSVVERVDETFCSLFPLSAPTIVGSFIVPPGDGVDARLTMTPGSWRLGAGGAAADMAVRVGEEGADALSWSPGVSGSREVRSGEVALRIENPGSGRVRVQLARTERDVPILPASYLTTFPEFRRTMSDQVLAPDIRISTRSVCLLFSDLTGSTAMYEELGDARAFAVVRDHFAVLRQAVEAHGGVVVKTIGDAVMAAFHDASDGIEAALDMLVAFDAWIATQGLENPPGLKVGVHTGPALVVHTDAAGIDYFGQTVNVAARVQGVAGGGELVFSASCNAWSGVTEAIAGRSLRAEPIAASLKGLSEEMVLFRVSVGPRTDPDRTVE